MYKNGISRDVGKAIVALSASYTLWGLRAMSILSIQCRGYKNRIVNPRISVKYTWHTIDYLCVFN